MEPLKLDLDQFSNAIIKISPAAVQAIKQVIAAQSGESAAIRLYARNLGIPGIRYGMTIDEKIRDNDTLIEIQEIRIVIDPSSIEYLRGASIDYDDTQPKTGFKINAPNKNRQCATKQAFQQNHRK